MALTTIRRDRETTIHEETTLHDVGSASPDLDDPELSAVCDGDSLIISSNGVPLYGPTEGTGGDVQSLGVR
jgi:hypothetical protein